MTKTEINELEVAAKEGNALFDELQIIRRYTLETGGITKPLKFSVVGRPM